MTDIIISLGSNHNQQKAITKAQAALRSAFDDEIRFSRRMWTEPIGMVSDRFLNCLGFAQTVLTRAETTALLKKIEADCGNTEELRKEGIIEMDIDLLLYGHSRMHIADWRRDYVKTLMHERQTINVSTDEEE